MLSKVLANMATIAIRGRGMAAVAAGKYLLSCRAGYREGTTIGIEPSSELLAACVDAGNVRERILARIAALNGPPDPDFSEAYKEPAEGE